MDVAAPAVRATSEGALPLMVARWAREAGPRPALFVARDEPVLRALVAALPGFAPDRAILALPAWDSLPYDRARPSRAITGTRVATLAALAERRGEPALVVTTPEALLQRVPPPARLIERAVPLATGDPHDPDWLRATLEAFGYVFDERVDEPGEAAIRAGTVDVHLAGAATPVRLELDEGRIAAIRRFDPVTQRSTAACARVLLLPVSEGFTVPGEAVADGSPRIAERLLPDGPLATVFDYLADPALALMDGVAERIGTWLALVRDAHDSARAAMRAGAAAPMPPDRLYLQEPEIAAALDGTRAVTFSVDEADPAPPLPPAAAARHVAERQAAGEAVIVCGDAAPAALRAMLARRLRRSETELEILPDWPAAERLASGRIGVLRLTLSHGFTLPDRAIIALRTARADQRDDDALEHLAGGLRIGDLVVDPERGLARLTELTMETAAGAPRECLALAFLGGARLLVPATEAGRIWRYGATSTLSPDRLDGGTWQDRRAQAEREIAATAAALVARMRRRAAMRAPVITAGDAYQRFVRRMPFVPTADQVRAIRAVRQDLAAGRPMHRLVCGDVGFGKTEVALHAAAIVALAGRQVAIVAPTTLLARQHLETFRRRLGRPGLAIEPLVRAAGSAAGKAVTRGLAEGRIAVVVGTQAVLAARFRDLGLVVVDEEQRFGAAQKRRLRRMQDNAHTLVMTATPLPRSLQGALLGLMDVSLLTTAPSLRQPVRGLVAPFDPVTVRGALLHEARRGGQSFVVCPRIEDIAPMAARLQSLAPELSVTVAHGRMRGEALDQAMLEFAAGGRDILLATNIVEAGLDLPNANTMLIWRADRFGLAQLHQLRGRVGRGRMRGSAWLLTDPAHPPSAAARARMETVATLDRLGAGFAISLADLDQRGAGDLLGEDQAGHMRLIGTELYRDVLTRALARARGQPVPEDWTPEIVLDVPAHVPEAFVPDPDLRLDIYRRLAHLATTDAVDETAAELADRFGEPPEELSILLDLVRLRLMCRMRDIAALHAGPAAVALTPRAGAMPALVRLPGARRNGERVILPIAQASPVARLRAVLAALDAAAPGNHDAPRAVIAGS